MPQKKGVLDTPRNRIIIDLHRKGMSYNKIVRELARRNLGEITPQRCHQVVTNPPQDNWWNQTESGSKSI